MPGQNLVLMSMVALLTCTVARGLGGSRAGTPEGKALSKAWVCLYHCLSLKGRCSKAFSPPKESKDSFSCDVK